MTYNKVVFDGKTLIDLTQDTVTPEKIIKGYTAHAADGSTITGEYKPPQFTVDVPNQTLIIAYEESEIVAPN